jgi:adenylate cyclase
MSARPGLPWETRWQTTRDILRIVLPLAFLTGGLLGWALGGRTEDIVAGVVAGGVISLGISAFENAWLYGPAMSGLREQPFVVRIVIKCLAWSAIVTLSLSAALLGMTDATWPEAVAARGPTLAASLATAAVVDVLVQIRQLLGRRVLWRVITGQYHRAREEERVVMFLDLKDSTALAEKLGTLRYVELLRWFVADITPPVVRGRGEIYKYLGDGVIVVWLLEAGLRRGACLAALAGIQRVIADREPDYRAEFGSAPEVRAGLHVGPVVVGEIGTAKQEVAYLGDTVNTTARIEDACRALDRAALVSAELVRRTTPPAGVVLEPLGPQNLRGKAEPIELFAFSIVK